MPKLKNFDIESDPTPCKIRSCTCNQCKYVRNKRKNKGLKKRIKRMLNKKRRTMSNKYVNFYWA